MFLLVHMVLMCLLSVCSCDTKVPSCLLYLKYCTCFFIEYCKYYQICVYLDIYHINESTGVQNPHCLIIAISLHPGLPGFGWEGGGGDVTALSKTMYASAVQNVHYNTCNHRAVGAGQAGQAIA